MKIPADHELNRSQHVVTMNGVIYGYTFTPGAGPKFVHSRSVCPVEHDSVEDVIAFDEETLEELKIDWYDEQDLISRHKSY